MWYKSTYLAFSFTPHLFLSPLLRQYNQSLITPRPYMPTAIIANSLATEMKTNHTALISSNEASEHIMKEHNYCSLRPAKNPEIERLHEEPFPPLVCSYCRNEVTDQASFMKTTEDVQPLILCRDCHVAKFLCGNNKRGTATSKGADETSKRKSETTRTYIKRNSDTKPGGQSGTARKSNAGETFVTKISWDEDIFVSPKEDEPAQIEPICIEETPLVEELVHVDERGVTTAVKEVKSRETLSVLGEVLDVGRDSPVGEPGKYYVNRHKKFYRLDMTPEIFARVGKSCTPNCRFRLESEGGNLVANLVSTATVRAGDEITVPFSAEMGRVRPGCVHCEGDCVHVVESKLTGGKLRSEYRPKKRPSTDLSDDREGPISRPMNREDRKIQSYVEFFEQMAMKEAGTKARKSGGVREKSHKKADLVVRAVKTPRVNKPAKTPRVKLTKLKSKLNYSNIRSQLMNMCEASACVEQGWADVSSAAIDLSLFISVLGTLERSDTTPSSQALGESIENTSEQEMAMNGQCFSDISSDFECDCHNEDLSNDKSPCMGVVNDAICPIVPAIASCFVTNLEIKSQPYSPMEMAKESPADEPRKGKRISISDYRLKRQKESIQDSGGV